MDLPPGSSSLTNERAARCREALWEEISGRNSLAELHKLLSMKGRIRLELSRRSRTLATRTDWLLTPVLELVARQARRQGCWKFRGDEVLVR